MPTFAGNVGTDYTFGYFDANSNSLIDMGDIQDVKILAQKHDLANRPYNNVPKFDFAPDGFRITFSLIRNVSLLEDIAIVREANFNAGGINRSGYLNKIVKNLDGSISRFQYYGFVFFLTDRADISREKLVTQKGEGFASGVRNL